MDVTTEAASLELHATTPLHVIPLIDMLEPAHSPAPAIPMQNDFAGPSRRVRPHRARKAGFGSVEIDNLIIEAIERDDKLKSLIPPDIALHCTTDSSKLPNAHEIVDSITFEAEQDEQSSRNLFLHSYFRNAEVRESLRNQQRIETAEFGLITQEDVKEALEAIPPELLYKGVDLSDETFRRRHVRAQKVETRTRNREKERLNYEVARLGDRLPQLEAMEISMFRGDTSEEQEKDKQRVLKFARMMVNRTIDNRHSDSDDGQPDGTMSARPVAREKKPRPPKKARAIIQGDGVESVDGAIPKPPKASKKKESRYIYQPDELAFEEVYELELPEFDEEYFEASSLKRPKRSKKRKRVAEPEFDPALYESIVPAIAPAPKKPKKSSSNRKRSAFHRPVAVTLGEKAVNRLLLEQANRYNPNRQPRDIYPFGALIPHILTNFVDFELPEWIERGSRPQSMQPSDEVIGQSEPVEEGEDEDGLYDTEGIPYEDSGVLQDEGESEVADYETGMQGASPSRREEFEGETSLSSLESEENGPQDETSQTRRRGGVRY